ncbi:M24 family metallopeptidase [Actinomycetospora lemnae]|uniref:Aminopeptidase P family protein n=1 Tax=Actinomycetospora lemnae TaxID=3019891 RepID=A0ABT5SQ06_9PSEU|nr:aminopeptidase P family protein [Actinomycetospora sp. DW7H6]MDD7964746.1 aminopeptidase P family protein [Actinomycetospora sp. DW7H6]
MEPTRPERAPGGHARRRDALRRLLREGGLDALLVTDLVNVRYLTGFTGSNAALLVHADDEADRGEDRTVLATDGRYTTQAAAQTPDLAVLVERACAPALLRDREGRDHEGIVGFDSAHVTVDGHADLLTALEHGELRRAPGLVETLRAVKEAGEVDALRQACAAADVALAGMIAAGGLVPGRTEREVARDLEERMREAGAEGPSFDTIVAAGAHAAIPHHRPTDAPLADGDLLTMDFGALVDGYHSDMTRTVLIGTPADWQRDLHDLVAEAAAAGRAALAPGVATRDVDAAARDVITAAGFGEQFVHGLGHGVGLVIHEAPAVSATATATLEAGMTVTVEPGVYLAGRGGVRIEDTLVVTDDGAAPLTQSPRDLEFRDDP